MSLNYDFTDIEDWEELHKNPNELALSSMLALNMMNIGMRSVTENNWKEVFRRIHILEHGIFPVAQTITRTPFEKVESTPYYYTVKDITRRIGLRTNAAVMSKVKFKEHIYQALNHEALRELTRWRDDQV